MPLRTTTIAGSLVVALAWIGLAIAAVGGVQDIRPSIVPGGVIAKIAQSTSDLERALRDMITAVPKVQEQVRTSLNAALTPAPGERLYNNNCF